MKKDSLFRLAVSLLLSGLYYGYFFGTATCAAAVIGLLRLISAPFDASGQLVHRLTRLLSWHYVVLNPGWRVEVTGLEHLQNQSCCIMVANHQSLMDVLVLSRVPGFYKWVAKVQILRMLGVGHLMRINGYIPVAHGDVRSVRYMLRRCRRWLQDGVSIFIFPEGERSLDGRLLPFKDGPFRLACQTQTPVLPIAIDGTMDVLPRGRAAINFRATVRLTLLPPIHPHAVGYDARRLNEATREAIASELGHLPAADIDQSLPSTECLISRQAGY